MLSDVYMLAAAEQWLHVPAMCTWSMLSPCSRQHALDYCRSTLRVPCAAT